MTPVNIFGDGDPDNGIEDSRQRVMGGRGAASGLADQPLNAGTIFCDGKIRGSAMVVDTRSIRQDIGGAVLISAAHVLFDLETKRLFRRCEFHFLALDQIKRYRAKIDLEDRWMGDFDPLAATDDSGFGEGDWVFLYIRKPWKAFRPDQTLALADYSFLQGELFRQSGGEVRLIAFDTKTGGMSSSRNCTVVESHADDLGGGVWKGQLLDDCDSAGGASGGGIVAVVQDKHYLVGIRSGSHWSEETYPFDVFPKGPPDGSAWDRYTNTNFGRAIDVKILRELESFLNFVVKNDQTF